TGPRGAHIGCSRRIVSAASLAGRRAGRWVAALGLLSLWGGARAAAGVARGAPNRTVGVAAPTRRGRRRGNRLAGAVSPRRAPAGAAGLQGSGVPGNRESPGSCPAAPAGPPSRDA